MSAFHKVITGDCLEVLRTLDAGIDAVVTDCPYGLFHQHAEPDPALIGVPV